MRQGSHTVSRITAHIVWVTKYRYPVLKGEVQKRCRELIIQICDAEDIRILKGVVSADHIHMHIEYPPKISISDIVKNPKEEHQGEFKMNIQASKRNIGEDIFGQ